MSSCLHPFIFKFMDNQIETGCGHCINCIAEKTNDLTFLCQREQLYRYSKGQSCSFVTLTYNEDNIPKTKKGYMTLRKLDYQNFLKNMRRQLEYYGQDIKFRYLSAGEIGSFGRPHYHIIFFGLSPEYITPLIRKLWTKGIIQIGPLGSGGIRYVCKYISKGFLDYQTKDLRKKLGIEQPFLNHSINLGREWLIQNMYKIAKQDKFQYNLNGKLHLYPKPIAKFISNHTNIDYRPIYKSFIKNQYPDKTDEQISDIQKENAIINAQNRINALISKGLTINDDNLKIKYYHPRAIIYYPKCRNTFINSFVDKALKIVSS